MSWFVPHTSKFNINIKLHRLITFFKYSGTGIFLKFLEFFCWIRTTSSLPHHFPNLVVSELRRMKMEKQPIWRNALKMLYFIEPDPTGSLKLNGSERINPFFFFNGVSLRARKACGLTSILKDTLGHWCLCMVRWRWEVSAVDLGYGSEGPSSYLENTSVTITFESLQHCNAPKDVSLKMKEKRPRNVKIYTRAHSATFAGQWWQSYHTSCFNSPANRGCKTLLPRKHKNNVYADFRLFLKAIRKWVVKAQ